MRINIRTFLLFGIIVILSFSSCDGEKKKGLYDDGASGSLSIAYPEQLGNTMDLIIEKFNEDYPLIKINKNKISGVNDVRELYKKTDSCDILIYDDYKLIEAFLIPNITQWTIKFARDEIVIACNETSLYKDEFITDNWYQILLKPNVLFGRIDPLNKTCGYRTESVFKLAAKYYNNPDLSHELNSKHQDLVYSNSKKLIKALKERKIDYAIIFKSMAVNNDLEYFKIPKIMNLNHPDLFNYYSKTNIQILDKDSINPYPMQGAPIIYGLSIMGNTPNMNNSLIFSEYFLSKNKGLIDIANVGIIPMIPSQSFYYKILPESLKKFNKE